MLRDRYEPVDLFALVPQLQLAFDPQLAQLDRLLDDDEFYARVRGIAAPGFECRTYTLQYNFVLNCGPAR